MASRSSRNEAASHPVNMVRSTEMPPPIDIPFSTIAANYCYHAGQFGSDGLHGNPHGHGLPGGSHVFRAFGRFFTHHRTSRMVGSSFLETMPVNDMAIGHFMRGISTGKQIVLTHRTITHVFASLAMGDRRIAEYRYTCHNRYIVENSLDHALDKIRIAGNDSEIHHPTSRNYISCSDRPQIVRDNFDRNCCENSTQKVKRTCSVTILIN
ncbi:hypothetical protein G9A89_002944 [Geosiphon pyriformis]|nr:hypothetical protein G9A89_002944 [Geosiphon pyriformis]